MTARQRYLRIAVPSPLHGCLDYLPPAGANPQFVPGQRLRVPLGRRDVVGLLTEVADRTDVPGAKLKPARCLLDPTPVVPPDMLALVRWAAEYYHHPVGEAVQALLPVPLRQGKPAVMPGQRTWRLTPTGRAADPATLTRAPRQQALLDLLQTGERGWSTTELAECMPAWKIALRGLARRGWVEWTRETDSPVPVLVRPPALPLNDAQRDSSTAVMDALGRYRAFLLDGVTGSGKTEVYLECIAEVLRRGLQALVLLPEINLTPQTVARFRARFGEVSVFHSGLTDSERLAAWLAARDGAASVVIGTRSAVWVPLARPGLVIVDEEHDASYKQQEGFRYSARDTAVVRAQRSGVPVILGSATPSLESLHNALQKRYAHLHLPERAGRARHPRMRLLDIRSRPLVEGLSDLLLDAVQGHLAAGGQVLLFLNRRGYAPTCLCHACGNVEACARCDARMTLHGRSKLVCHHCGAERPLPERCGHCGGPYGLFGQGTERIEQALMDLFPDAGVVRVDRDSTRRKGSLENILDEVQRGSRRLLVGTQMLAKGHDFPGVTLVGILDADQGLFSADFRASERMAQLITQVAGRAGRADKPGEVLIQTHQPGHPLLQHLIREGYASFAAAALAERLAAGLPPHGALALLRAESAHRDPPYAFLEAARERLAARDRQVALLGPAPAPMERRAGRYRAHLLLHAPQRAALQRVLSDLPPVLHALKQARRVRWSLDVDPVTLD